MLLDMFWVAGSVVSIISPAMTTMPQGSSESGVELRRVPSRADMFSFSGRLDLFLRGPGARGVTQPAGHAVPLR